MTQVSVGFVVGMIGLAVIALWGAGCLVVGFTGTRDDEWLIVGTIFVWIVTAGIALWALWPLDMRYHEYTRVQGTVQTVNARMVAEDQGTTQQYGVILTGAPSDYYRCDDTRCGLLKPGQHVTLWCIKEFQFHSTPGWGCNWGGVDPA